MSADHLIFDARIRYARFNNRAASAAITYPAVEEPFRVTLEAAVIMTAVISRRHGYAELIDVFSQTVIAVFLFGNQLTLNRVWRDEWDPSYTEPEAQKEIS